MAPTKTRSGARSFPSASVLAGLGLAAFAALGAVRYADGPPLAHTGGFGEPTCLRCHADSPGDSAARLTLDGAPANCAPARTYPLTLRLVRAGMARAGFQMSARFTEGTGAGRQAGAFSPLDDRVQVVAGLTATPAGDSARVEYAQHSVAGTGLVAPDSAAWTLEWTAPERVGAVALHVAANAANYDDSEFGDHIAVGAFRACHADTREPR